MSVQAAEIEDPGSLRERGGTRGGDLKSSQDAEMVTVRLANQR